MVVKRTLVVSYMHSRQSHIQWVIKEVQATLNHSPRDINIHKVTSSDYSPHLRRWFNIASDLG